MMKNTFTFLLSMAIILAAVLFNKLNAQVTLAEYQALEAIYNATDGNNWTDNTGWDFTGDENDVTDAWYGLIVVAGHVELINLQNNNLSGTIPTEIGDFLELSELRINNNSLTGTIPGEIGGLTNLVRLDLNDNSLTGNLPADMGLLSSAEIIQLQNNSFTGIVPASFQNLLNIRRLILSNNDLTNLPDLSACVSLEVLRVQNNSMQFDAIEQNIGIASSEFTYSPQAKVGNYEEYTMVFGESRTISVTVGGVNNTYQWYLDGVEIVGATSTSYTIASFDDAIDEGTYHCEIENTVATALTLISEDIVLIYFGDTEPIVETATPQDITTESARLGGNVTSSGGASVSERGVFLSDIPDAVTNGVQHTMGFGIGTFNDVIESLLPGTTYYVLAYATNSVGTAYGDELTFTTSAAMPTVVTDDATSITAESARLGGEVTDDGGSDLYTRGVYYGLDQNTETTGVEYVIGNGMGEFSDIVEGLNPGTTYYFRAFVDSSEGIALGEEKSFTTLGLPPEVITEPAYDITNNSAMIGGIVDYDGGVAITGRGVYWGTDSDPQSSGVQMDLGAGLGEFSGLLDGLEPVTTYYFVAYATNSAGTGYGEVEEFTTEPSVPDVITVDASEITNNSARINAEVLFNGGAEVTERGFYWGLNPDPIDDGENISLAGDEGSFSEMLSGLEATTTYYFQAYAVNSVGAEYGEVLSFITELEQQIVFFPNAFNPNSHIEVNRTFKPIFEFVPSDYSMIIFNRWGSVVFSSEDFTQGWNGTADGAKAPVGPYSYKVQYTDEKGETHTEIGIVTLVN